MKPDLSSAAAHDRPSLCDRMLSNSWFVMVWLAFDYFVLYLHRSVLNFVLPPLQAELQITEAQIGNMQMAFLLSYCFSQLFVGYLGDRFHRRTVLLVSLIGSIVCLVGKGMVVSFSQLILLQIALGALQSASDRRDDGRLFHTPVAVDGGGDLFDLTERGDRDRRLARRNYCGCFDVDVARPVFRR